MSAVTTFDPIKFKATTRTQWENAADAWHRWGPFLLLEFMPCCQTRFVS